MKKKTYPQPADDNSPEIVDNFYRSQPPKTPTFNKFALSEGRSPRHFTNKVKS